jgi:hypothetical protein
MAAKFATSILILASFSALASHALVHAGPFAPTSPQTADEVLPPVDRSASEAARSELTQARLALLRSQSGMSSVVRAADNIIAQSNPIRDARRAAMAARVKYESLQRPILEQLRKDEEYAALHNDRTTARQMIEQLVAENKREFLDLLPYAKAALEAGRKMTRSEVIAGHGPGRRGRAA